MRRVGVVTGSRADYGVYRPLLQAITAEPILSLCLFVTGMHLSTEFGATVGEIETDGFPIAARVESLLSSDTPEGIAKSMGLGVIGFAQAYAKDKPDILVVLGDRFEMHAAALAALPFKIPVVHIHGGELTQGAFDDALRHSITKLSHLHCVATEEYARRVMQMGEEPWRVVVCGALGLDNLARTCLLSRRELERRTGICLEPDPLIVTFHPVTLEYESAAWQIEELLTALKYSDRPIVFTGPNADTCGRMVAQRIMAFVEQRPGRACLVDNLGTQAYFSLMTVAGAMVGNSSSGIIEAMSFELPVVNVGTRQQGRLHPQNVIDVGYRAVEIKAGIKKALDPSFREGLRGQPNLNGDGHAAERILRLIRDIPLDERLVIKRFGDLQSAVGIGMPV